MSTSPIGATTNQPLNTRKSGFRGRRFRREQWKGEAELKDNNHAKPLLAISHRHK